jgi:hypothetical protein
LGRSARHRYSIQTAIVSLVCRIGFAVDGFADGGDHPLSVCAPCDAGRLDSFILGQRIFDVKTALLGAAILATMIWSWRFNR